MKNKKKLLFLICAWAVMFGLLMSCRMNKIPDARTFDEKVSVTEKKDKVGANIRLKQTIHGTEGIKYRYIVKTDCEKWDFETRYMTDVPIDWVNDETSAAEADISSVQVRYDGAVYASGTYYTVPILGGLSSESVSKKEWKQGLMKQAYQSYQAYLLLKNKATLTKIILLTAGLIISGVMILLQLISEAKRRRHAIKDAAPPKGL